MVGRAEREERDRERGGEFEWFPLVGIGEGVRSVGCSFLL